MSPLSMCIWYFPSLTLPINHCPSPSSSPTLSSLPSPYMNPQLHHCYLLPLHIACITLKKQISCGIFSGLEPLEVKHDHAGASPSSTCGSAATTTICTRCKEGVFIKHNVSYTNKKQGPGSHPVRLVHTLCLDFEDICISLGYLPLLHICRNKDAIHIAQWPLISSLNPSAIL